MFLGYAPYFLFSFINSFTLTKSGDLVLDINYQEIK